jgi:phenylacetate-CoA ligase
MLRALYISAEGYSPAWAQAMEEFWGAPLHEGYGSTQAVGFALTSCPSGRTEGPRLLHAIEWMNVCEVVDPATGEPVGPGEVGELILTNLDISGSPCIRFATRDRVRYFPHHACGCGRPWACVEAGTIGRYDDMMKIRGNNVWPTAIDQLMFAEPEVAEYAGRVFVDDAGRTEVLVRVALTSAARAAAPGLRADVLRRLARLLKDTTNVAMRLEEVDRAALPTFAYKSRRWQDERQRGYDRAGKGTT